MGFLIRDGYTLPGLIPAKKGLYDEVTFKYRPALAERCMEYFKADQEAKGDPKEAAKKEKANVDRLLLEHLSGWSEPDPISAETLMQVPYPALMLMVNHVTCYAATDWAEREKN